jgi:hypothetical protein
MPNNPIRLSRHQITPGNHDGTLRPGDGKPSKDRGEGKGIGVNVRKMSVSLRSAVESVGHSTDGSDA